MKTFLICPVRGHSISETEEIVRRLEAGGIDVYWPPRDTNQDDPTGMDICKENLSAITGSDYVSVVWDGISQGCLFDLGMAFALGKRINIISIPPKSNGKSFQNMMTKWEESQIGTGL